MKSLIAKLGLVVLVLSGVLVVLFFETLAGTWALQVSRWHEEEYVGRDLTALRADLEGRGVEVRASDEGSLFSQTGRRLAGGEKAFVFRHGEPYSWFRVGTAVNVGYVVVRTEGNAHVVVDVYRAKQVDSL